MTAHILVVEDNPVQSKLTEHCLKNEYEVTQVEDGEAAIAVLESGTRIDLVLLDVMMPGLSGYEVCRRIKDQSTTADLPVIFLSAKTDEEDRLKGYEAGGHDYLCKPFSQGELLSKIGHLIRLTQERQSYKDSAQFASSTAMTAMTSAAEQGEVLNFMRSSFACSNYSDLAEAIVAACGQLGLRVLVQLRGASGKINHSSNGPCTPLEASVLENMSLGSRITDLGPRTAVRFDMATVVALDMPRDNPDRYGRLKDHLAMLTEAADARAHALDAEWQIKKQLIARAASARTASEQLLRVGQAAIQTSERNGDAVHQLIDEVTQLIPLLDLSANQERQLLDLMHRTEQRIRTNWAENKDFDNAFAEALAALESEESNHT